MWHLKRNKGISEIVSHPGGRAEKELVEQFSAIVDYWLSISDERLSEEIRQVSSIDVLTKFIRIACPMIMNMPVLRERLSQILLRNIEKFNFDLGSYDYRANSIYIASVLRVDDIKDIILELIKKNNTPLDITNSKHLAILNDSILELKLKEAEEFLCKEMEALSNIPKSHDRYYDFRKALYGLEILNPPKAEYYGEKYGLYPPKVLPVSEWNTLSYEDLKKEIKNRIFGPGGMGSAYEYTSFIKEFYKKIESPNLQKKVESLISEFINTANSLGGRSIYIYTYLPIDGKKEKILELTKKIDSIFKTIEEAVETSEWMEPIEYLAELNEAVSRLMIKEASDYLIKQLAPINTEPPLPPEKEYYLYYMSGISALRNLKIIDPELEKKYEMNVPISILREMGFIK